MERLRRRRTERSPAARVKFELCEDVAKLSYDHVDQDVGLALLADAVASDDPDFVNGLLGQLLNAAKKNGKVSEADFGFLLSVVKGVKPRDQLESMLAAQMAAIHDATMTLARRLNNVENIAQQDSALNGLTKLARTFATLLDALKRHRSGGEQKVIVQHVNVNDGGQAIVASVAAQPEPRPANAHAAAPALTHAPQTPMPIIGEPADAVPLEVSKHDDGKVKQEARKVKDNGRKPPP